MAEMWYYTCEGKQMDPVSIKELKHLAGDGVLKPTDMVWHDGMPRWIRASSVKELFPDPTAALDQYFTSPKEAAVPTVSVAPASAKTGTPEPAAAKKSGYAQADEEEPRTQKKRRQRDDEDAAPARRRTEASSGGSNVAIIVALLFGAFVILGAMIGGVVILIAAPRQPVNPPQPPPFAVQPMPPAEIKPAPVPIPLENPPAEVKPGADVKTGVGSHKEVKNLLPGEEIVYRFQVKAGHAAYIKVSPYPSIGADFNLYVFKERDNAQIASDEKPAASARVDFVLQASEIVYAKVKNAGKTIPQRFTLGYNVGD